MYLIAPLLSLALLIANLIATVHAVRLAQKAWGLLAGMGVLAVNMLLFTAIFLGLVSPEWIVVGVFVTYFGPLICSAKVMQVAQRVIFTRLAESEEVVPERVQILSTFD